MATAPQVATAMVPVHFAMVVSNQPDRVGTVSTEGDSRNDAPATDDTPVAERDVSSPARLTGSLSPVYPASARAQEVEADVVLSIVVTPAGRVTDIQVVRAAGYGFEDAALQAVREARFIPARREGRAVAVRMRWTVAFRLR